MGNYFLARKIEEVQMQVLGLDLENSYSFLGSGESAAAFVSLYQLFLIQVLDVV